MGEKRKIEKPRACFVTIIADRNFHSPCWEIQKGVKPLPQKFSEFHHLIGRNPNANCLKWFISHPNSPNSESPNPALLMYLTNLREGICENWDSAT